jgi:hypothetical protein
MCHNRFEEIWMNLVFTAQLEERPHDMPSVLMDLGGQFCGQLQSTLSYTFLPIRTGNFLAFLANLTISFTDKSMIWWYGVGGDWINEGFPHYVEIDFKPENGCEIQNAACSKTGIMMELHVVKGPGEERLVRK